MTPLLDWSYRQPRVLDAHGRCACVLVLDTSSSMQGPKLDALNEALRRWGDALTGNPRTYGGVDLAIVSFGTRVDLVRAFSAVSNYAAPRLEAADDADTADDAVMVSALARGLSLLETQRQAYTQQDIASYKSWLVLVTDGSPGGSAAEIDALGSALAREQAKGKLQPCVIGFPGASFDQIARFAPDRRAFQVSVEKLGQLMAWLVEGLTRVSIVRDTERFDVPREIATTRFEIGAQHGHRP
jgi:uncharacterized protein YegL